MISRSSALSGMGKATSLGWLMLVFMLTPLAGWPQDDADEGDEESSQHVEESEEAYRRRMELEEARDQADVIPDRTSGTLKAPEGIDALPYESRKHLRDELRNVIIEQGEWQPEDANANYPYTPSAAAQTDPELRQQEEKAWGELIQEYHKREAAALESGGGRNSGSSPGQGQGQGQGQGGQAGSNGSESSKSGSPGSRSADGRPETEATSSTAAGAGVSQSALEFLKGQSGGQAGGQAGGQQSAAAGGQPSGAAGSPGSPQAGGQSESSPAATAAVGAEKTPAETQQQVAQAAASQSESSNEDKSKEKEASDNPPPPPGSLAIAELVALEEGRKHKAAEEAQAASKKAQEQNPEAENSQNQDAEQQQTQSVVLRNEAEQPPPRPGTLAIPELEKLKGVENEAPVPVKTP